MKIEIEIEDNGNMTLKHEGLPPVYVMGVLRYFEKIMWVELTKQSPVMTPAPKEEIKKDTTIN